MPSLVHQRCLNHAEREAVARCPECTLYYCRECVTEHDDRVICATCLAKITEGPQSRQRGLAVLRRVAFAVLGLVVAWFFYYALAQTLLQIPAQTHSTSSFESPTGR